MLTKILALFIATFTSVDIDIYIDRLIDIYELKKM